MRLKRLMQLELLLQELTFCEVNSNAHFKNIQTCTGVAVADKIVEWIIKDVRK